MKIKFLPKEDKPIKVKDQPVGDIIKVDAEDYTGLYLILTQKSDTHGSYAEVWDFVYKVVTQIQGEYSSNKLESTLNIEG